MMVAIRNSLSADQVLDQQGQLVAQTIPNVKAKNHHDTGHCFEDRVT
jgi:hypothetical protein